MHLELFDLFILSFVFIALYAWWRNITIREVALARTKKHCQSLDLQLLDDSIAGTKWLPIWHQGQIKIRRHYRFEFTSSGLNRYLGHIQFIGKHQESIWLSPHDF